MSIRDARNAGHIDANRPRIMAKIRHAMIQEIGVVTPLTNDFGKADTIPNPSPVPTITPRIAPNVEVNKASQRIIDRT